MGTERTCHGVAELNGFIYSAGGHSCTSIVNSVERFDPLTLSWISIKPLEIKRSFFRLVAMPEYNCLYAVGGHSEKFTLNSVERLDPRVSLLSDNTFKVIL